MPKVDTWSVTSVTVTSAEFAAGIAEILASPNPSNVSLSEARRRFGDASGEAMSQMLGLRLSLTQAQVDALLRPLIPTLPALPATGPEPYRVLPTATGVTVSWQK